MFRKLHLLKLLPSLFLFFSCFEMPLEPVLPIFDVQLSVPLANKLTTFDELIENSSITRDSPSDTSGYTYYTKQNSKPYEIEKIEVNPRGSVLQAPLGVFQIDFPASLSSTFSFKAITGTDPPLVPVIFPPATYPVPEFIYPGLQSFEYAEFESGNMTLTVRNDLPFQIAFLDPIRLINNRLFAPTDTNEVVRFSFLGQQLLPGQTIQQTVSIAGKRVQNLLKLTSVRIQTPGTSTARYVEESSSLQYQIVLSNASVRAVKGNIPKQSTSTVQSSQFVLDDSISVQSATFKSGSINLVIDNGIDAKMVALVKLNEIKNRATGQSLTIRREFQGKEKATIPLSARDYLISQSKDTLGTVLSYSVEIESIESGFYSEVRSTDIVRAELVPVSPFVVESLTGRIKPMRMEFNSGAPGMDISDQGSKLKGSINLDSVKITLGLRMGSGFPTDYNLKIIAMNRKAVPIRVDSLVLPPPVGSSQRRFFPANNMLTQIVLDNSVGLNTFLSKFFPHFPDTFIVRGSVVVNPPDVYSTPQGVQTIRDTTKVYSDVDVAIPLRFGLVGVSFTDTVGLTNGEKIPKDVINSVKKGTLYFEITNALPIQLQFRTAFLGALKGGKRDTLVSIPLDGQRTILPAFVNQNGIVQSPQTSIFSISVRDVDMEQINASEVMWFNLAVETSAGGSSSVRFRSTDNIRIRASANVVYTINKK